MIERGLCYSGVCGQCVRSKALAKSCVYEALLRDCTPSADRLRQSLWNRRIAAEQLKISYKALLYKIREYGLDVPGAA